MAITTQHMTLYMLLCWSVVVAQVDTFFCHHPTRRTESQYPRTSVQEGLVYTEKFTINFPRGPCCKLDKCINIWANSKLRIPKALARLIHV